MIGKTLDRLYEALGMLDDETEGEFVAVINAAISNYEDLFCRLDRKGYREWAIRFLNELGEAPEPCDEWFTEDEPWIDEVAVTMN